MGQKNHDYLLSADLFGADAERERARLKGIEALWDPGSQSLLAELGLGSEWRCLEVGAGGGSLVKWMAGRGAAVTAVDIDTRFIEHLGSENVDIRCLDIRTDALPPGEFDLIHTRLVLEHLCNRQQILGRLAATLRPGGLIVIEALDWSYFSWVPVVPALDAMSTAVLDYAEQAGGLDTSYGRHLLTALNEAGLADVRGQGRAHVIDVSCQGFDFFKLTIESLRQQLIDIDALSEAEAKTVDTCLRDRHLRINTPLMMAGIGRR
ncbi:hypothetical protein A5724_12690 [Mycobacterium sp. ACS1612]|uniref:class I SAM-dependent methyltransferase n=1 Tax=Mycobacterium sp. ACS1612 TaxID=1834117 RepID=UPI0007FB8D83|nr:class I SAM-dependent methyltransferase [Mycobacterium sp. ACS1612]OBF36720.1 hypothetical protein A5724_12690 [Mycobacterium sp. ACS1612]